MKINSFAAVGTLLALTACTSFVTASPGADLAGTYYVQGVREVGAELRLGADGRFSYAMVYGGSNQAATGTWELAGERLKLVADAGDEPHFVWGRSTDTFEGDPDRPVDLVVRVETPELGMAWRNIEVATRYSNGQTRTGLTGSGGLLAFEARKQGRWANARPRKIGVAYPTRNVPQQWFDIPNGIKTAHISFVPGKLMASAFEQLQLNIARSGDKQTALIVIRDDGKDGWRFERAE